MQPRGGACADRASLLATCHRRYPTLHRPYRIPLPTWACILMLTPASILLAGLLLVPWIEVGALCVCVCVGGGESGVGAGVV